MPGLLPVSAALPSMDHEHGTVCHPILEHQIRLSAPSSVISRPTCFSSSLRCCWQVGSAPFVRRRCDCLASFGAVYKYSDLLTYLLTRCSIQCRFPHFPVLHFPPLHIGPAFSSLALSASPLLGGSCSILLFSSLQLAMISALIRN